MAVPSGASRLPTSTRWCRAARRLTITRAPTRPRSTRRRRSSRCCPSVSRPLSPRSCRTNRARRLVVEMHVADDGAVHEASMVEARVLNRARLAYDATAAGLEGEAPVPAGVAKIEGLEECLRLQDRTAGAMRHRRQQEGALSLDSVQAQAVFDGEQLTGLRRDQKNRAKALIEGFMIAANGATARFLEDRGSPVVRRVLRTPKRW